MTTFARLMLEARQNKGWSMETVAQKAGVNRSSIWACENGKSVSARLLNQILDGYSIHGPARDTILSAWAMDQAGVTAPTVNHALEDAQFALMSCPPAVLRAVAKLVRTRKGREALVAMAKQQKAPAGLERGLSR